MIPKECKRLAEVDFPIAVVFARETDPIQTSEHGSPRPYDGFGRSR
jgi:hypothetical protein